MMLLSTKKWDALQGQLKAMQNTVVADMINNFSTRIFPDWSVVKAMDAYQTLDQVYCVVKKLATCSALIPFYGYDSKGEDLGENDPLAVFLNTIDFEEKEKLYTYLYLNGEVFAYKNRTELGANGGKLSSITFLHPDRVTVSISNEFPRQLVGYTYFEVETGLSVPISLDDMIFIKLFNPSSNAIDNVRGLSPVKVLSKAIDALKSTDNVTVSQLQNGGTPSIVFNKTPGVSLETTGVRANNFSRFIKNPSNKGAPYFAGDELGAIDLGSSLTDMDVVHLADTITDRVFNVFGVSSILFNNTSASTESNVQEMLKEMYTNTIIPNVYRVESALNRSAVPDIKTKGVIKCDTSDIKALQEDQSKLVTALAAAWWLTPNEKRTAQMYDQADDELMDKYLVPSGLTVLDDLVMTTPIDNTANDYVPTGTAAVVRPIKTGTNG